MLLVPRTGMLVYGFCSLQSILLCRLECRNCEFRLQRQRILSINPLRNVDIWKGQSWLDRRKSRKVWMHYSFGLDPKLSLSRFNILYISSLISSILILALWYTSFAQANLIAFAALYGIFSGPFFSVTPVSWLCSYHFSIAISCFKSCVTEISPIERVGARIGGTFAFMASATLAGTPISGLFIKEQTKDNFDKLILFSVSIDSILPFLAVQRSIPTSGYHVVGGDGLASCFTPCTE